MTDELMQEIEAEYLYQCRRSFETQDCGIAANLLDRIKTELSEKAARIAELTAAMEPFARALDNIEKRYGCDMSDKQPTIGMSSEYNFTIGDLRAARAALGEKE